MPTPDLPEIPTNLKSIQPYMKIADEHDQRDPVVSYWARLYSLQTGMKLSSRGPEERVFLVKLMDWLEITKTEQHDNEAITNEVAAQAHIENWALKLFLYADKNDRASNFTKNVVKSFYTAGLLYDILTTFGELSEEAMQNRKYAKWKAAYIHNCLKNGETPVPGPVNSEEDDLGELPKPDDETNVSDEDNMENAENSKEEKNDAVSEPQPDDESTDEVNEPQESASDNDENAVQPSQPTPPPSADPYGFPSPPGSTDPKTTSSSIPSYPNFPGENSTPMTPQPYNSPSTPINNPSPVDYSTAINTGGISLTPEQMTKVSKYIKWAGSAVNYDDVPTAVQNLQKALHLLTTGQDS